MNNININRILRFAIFGTIGFGIGGAFLGWAIQFNEDRGANFGDWETFLLIIGALLMGAFGGLVLGLALRNKMRILILVVTTSIGSFIASIVGIFTVTNEPTFINISLVSLTLGVVLGIAIGIFLLDWKKVIALSLFGAIGGIIGAAITSNFEDWSVWYALTIQGSIGGAILGGALGFLLTAEDEEQFAQRIEQVKLELKKTAENETQELPQDTGLCPYCNSSNIDEGLMYSWQRVCLDCRKEWDIEHK